MNDSAESSVNSDNQRDDECECISKQNFRKTNEGGVGPNHTDSREMEDATTSIDLIREPPAPGICSDTHRIPITSSGKELDKRLRSAIQEIADLKEQLQLKETDLQDCYTFRDKQDEECSSLKEAQNRRDKECGRPIEETIQHYNDLRKKLHNNLNERNMQSRFSRLPGNSHNLFARIDIRSGFEDIFAQSEQILCRSDCEKLPFIPTLEKPGKLQGFVYSCLSKSSQQPQQGSEVTGILSKLNPQAVARALATCAIRDWVFEQNFPQFDENPSKVLAAYRDVLAVQGRCNTFPFHPI